MTKLTDILAVGDQMIALGDNLKWLEPLTELGAKWGEIARQLNGLAEGGEIDSVESLFAFLNGKLENEAVVGAFDALGLGALRTQLLGFEEIYQDMPDAVKRLAAPLSTFAETEVVRDKDAPQSLGFRDDWVDGADPGEARLPLSLLSVEREGTTGKVDFNLSLAADAHIACEAGALWPYRRDAVAPGLLQVSLGGSLAAAAGGKLPFSSGSAKASISGGVSGELMYFVRPEKLNTIYAAELARALPDLPNPFALRPVWNAMATSRLEGMIIAIDGHAEVDLALSVGQDIDLPKVLSGKLGISATVSCRRKAAYVLSVRSVGSAALGNQRLLLALSRNKSAADMWGLGLGLELDLSPLIDRVHSVLEDALGEWSKELERVKPFLNPGTWIRENLTAELSDLATNLIKDEDLQQGLIDDLGVLLNSSDADESVLQKRLTEKLTAKLGDVAGLAKGAAEEKASEAVGRIVAMLPSLAQDNARATLDAAITGIVGKFQSAVDAELTAISMAAKPKEIGKALKSIGVAVDRKLDSADAALEGLRELVDHFDALLRLALEKTGESALKKVGAQLSFEEKRESSLDMEVVGMIDACTPEAEALYRSLLRGKLSALQALFDKGGNVPGFTLDKDQSSIRRFSKVSRKLGFAFVGFGIELSAYELLSGEADIRLLGNGDLAVTAKGELTKGRDGPREGRTLSFVSTYSLMLAKAENMDEVGREARFQQALSLGVTASHQDKSLKAGEVTGFLSGLAEMGLLRPDRVAEAGRLYETWSTSGGSDAKHPAGDVSVEMKMDAMGLQKLLLLGRSLRDEVATKGAMPATTQVFGVALDAMLATGRLSRAALLNDLDDARRRDFFSTKDKIADEAMLFGYLQSERRQAGHSVARRRDAIAIGPHNHGTRMSDLTNAMLALNGLADILQLMAEIHDASPADLDGKEGWSEKDYRKHEALLAASSWEWLRLNSKWILWFKESISRPTQAFLLTLISLSSGQSVDAVIKGALGDSNFTVTMTPRFGPPEKQVPVSV